MSEYKRIYLINLNIDYFCVKLKKDSSKKLIIKAKEKVGNFDLLSKILNKKCRSLKNNTLKTCKFKLFKYINNKFYLPLDCLSKICDILNIKLSSIEKEVEFLGVKYTKEPLNIKFPLVFNEDLATLSETIRTEGYLSKDLRRIELINQDKRILNNLILSLKQFNFKKEKYAFCLYSKITIPKNINKEEIKIINTKNKKIIKSFSIRNKRLKNYTKKQIHIHDYDISWGDEEKGYKIITPNKIINCFIKIPKKGKINSKSNYKDISTALKIIIRNITLGRLLNQITEIPKGNKSSKIYLPKIIKDSPKSVIKKAFETVFNCEGTIDKNSVGIRSISTKYLEDWQEILFKKFNIKSYITKGGTSLNISHRDNLIKFYKLFDLLPEEKKKIKEFKERKKILPPNTANEFYIKNVKELKGVTSRDLARIVNKTQACTKRALTGLYKRGLINRKKVWQRGRVIRYLYF